MITRRSARAISELIELTFRKAHYHNSRVVYYSPEITRLYDFLYDNGFAAWFCNAAKGLWESTSTRKLKEFFMKLHTGESVVVATPDWSWEQRELLGQRYLSDVAEDMLERWKDGAGQWGEQIDQAINVVKRSLELDGYKWDGKRLVPSEADALDPREEAGVVRQLYRSLSLGDEEVTFHHLALTEEHYLAGRWDDSISNSRKFLESTLAQVAQAFGSDRGNSLGPEELARPVRVRDYLERERLLESKEKQAVAAVYGLLSETGGHPYKARQEEARLMRHLALTFSQFVMLRLRGSRGDTQ